MYCEHCGGTMNDDARYCSHCGGARQVRSEPPTGGGSGFAAFAAPQLDPDLVGEVRPWLRYWARMFDITLLGGVTGIVLEIVAPGALDGKILGNLLGFVCMAAWVLIEPLHLVNSGTTPGKWLFKTRVITSDGRRTTYEDALMRSFRVWWRGLAVGVPLVNLGTMIAAHEHLTNRGVTSWDRDGGFTVVHRRLGPGRVLAIICVAIAFCALIGWGMTLDE